jgi:hypothetical protein
VNAQTTSRQSGIGTEAIPPQRRQDADDPISPELALVDPELARRARARLDSFDQPAPGAPAIGAEPKSSVAPRSDTRATSRRARVVLAAVAVMAGLAGAGFTAAKLTGENSRLFARGSLPGGSVVVRPQETGESTGKSFQRKPATRAQATSAAGGEQTRRSLPRANKANRPGIKQKKRRASSGNPGTPPSSASQVGGPTTPVFSWVAVRGVIFYDFELFRGATRVFTARPRQPRLALPSTWTYGGRRFSRAPGNYRWLVRPVFHANTKTRYGPAIVSAKLVLHR